MPGGGAGLTIVGLIFVLSEFSADATGFSNSFSNAFTGTRYSTSGSDSHIGGVLFLVGIGAMIGSSPLYSAARKNKRIANLICKDETVLFNPELKQHIVAVGVKINL